MDLMIKGMYMPKGDEILRLEILPNGQVNRIIGWAISEKRDAKAIELPPHGRLIDADAFFKRLQKQTMELWGKKSKEYQYFLDVMDMVKNAPTIVEASK